MNNPTPNHPAKPTPYPLPDLTGRWPDREVGLLCAAANLTFLAAWSHCHHHVPYWKVAVVIPGCLLFVLGLLLLLRKNERHRVLREVWIEQSATLYEVFTEVCMLHGKLTAKDLNLSNLYPLDQKWDQLTRGVFDGYHPALRKMMRDDLRNLDVIDRIKQGLSPLPADQVTELVIEELFTKLHLHYVMRVRYDGLFLLLSLAVANVFWMVIWW